MLTQLRIRNVAIIDTVTLPLQAGLNVLSGETGAGKSIVVEALGLLFGARGSADLVRTGAEKASVEGIFDVKDALFMKALLDGRGVEIDDDQIVLRREVSSGGRSRAWINSSPVPASVLAEVGCALVTIHGQHEAQGLLDPDMQRDILDAFGGGTAESASVAVAWDALASARRSLEDLSGRRAAAARRADYLRHVADEIGAARLEPEEEDRLEEEARRLSHVQELRLHAEQLRAAIDDDDEGALRRLGSAQRALDAAARLDPGVEKLRELLDSAFAQLEELTRAASAYESLLDVDPGRLAEVEQRRDLIFRLTRKHGGSVESALQALKDAQDELDLLDTASLDLGVLAERVATAEHALDGAAAALTYKRVSAADRLRREVDDRLPSVGMSGGRFSVRLHPRGAIERTGAEAVEFMVALNVGHDERALSRVASGGELSRVMLALTTILARLEPVPTLVFDEVDAGIGGRVALSVGDTLRQLAAHHQVLVITHLPQIASRAHQHVVVSKAAKSGVTTADLQVVEGAERVAEIARMLGGDPDSDTSRAHARELLDGAAASAPAARPARSGRTTGRRAR